MDNWFDKFRSIVSETEVNEDHLVPKDGEEEDEDSGKEGSGEEVKESRESLLKELTSINESTESKLWREYKGFINK
jgi:hypothetical protein